MLINILLISLTALVTWAVFYLVPPAQGLGEFVRIAFFHIPAAWVSVLAFLLSAISSLLYLRSRQPVYDRYAARSACIGLIFCILATVSGAVFANLTWGAYWSWDPRQITIFLLLLIYSAYFILRRSISDTAEQARIAAVYSLLAFLTVPFLVFIIPRYYFTLHPTIVSSGGLNMDGIMIAVLMAALADITLIYLRLLFPAARRSEL